MKLQEYKQLVADKLGIRQDTVKQQRGLIQYMVNALELRQCIKAGKAMLSSSKKPE